MSATVLIVEDDVDLREAITDTLALADIRYLEAGSAEEALELLKQHSVDMVVSDVNMPGMDGHALLARLKETLPALPVALITAYGQVSKAVEAIRNGAVDYLMKPFEPEQLIELIRTHAQGLSMATRDEPVAQAPGSRQLLQLAQRVAATDSTVLITGESGTGKEVLARYIHDHSSRADKPFIAINCAAIPESMLEATLFGHEKGAFTGAVSSQPGKFEQANGGTLLLDEISEMDLGLQAKLLRVLQEQEVERIGGRKVIPLDVRVLATSNRQLEQTVAEGKFREDLYYRLNVFPLQWQPLRERIEDIEPLALRLLAHHCRKMGRAPASLDSAAVQSLCQHSWPGNVRELDNVIQRALILQGGSRVLASDLHLGSQAIPLTSSMADVAPETVEEPIADGLLGNDLKQHEYQLIVEALKATSGSRKEAAEKLGISPRTLRYKLARMREEGIDLESMLAS
ncbi:sigma-54-dependent transcriptional regulator [Marinobacterium sediminicola]|uniref:Two-component system, response regulator FlrC n=1 Tax=Marinobacterium sediminicola TaxID=518898 RepID=A0ABY1RYC2_9GAMM|nr:sigma-54 dependent transcriptional regulator [Marinobacterium sediminicola]ULG68785.1 sigma-54 dependent transcriptional regulator [Marinobacterium sediminicola]SMR73314.1 two-component system, response regulator FlrC [Marinobacterium sediminicola]